MFQSSVLKQFLKIKYWRKLCTNIRHESDAMSFNVPLCEVSSLENGLRIASENWGTRTSTVGMWIGVGSRNEILENNGVAHFIEHMAFKGTEKRTQKSLELEVENKGAHLNAYTSREMVVFYAKCLNKDIEWAVELLSDMLRNSRFDNGYIEHERGTILREMEEIESTYQEVVFDLLHAKAYDGSSLGRTILGPEENIRSLSRSDLLTFTKNHYRANKMVLTAVGGIDHEWLQTLGQRYWGNVLTGVSDEHCEGTKFIGGDIRQSNDRMPQAHIAVALEGPGYLHTDTIALMVAASLNGNWDRNHAGMGQATSNLATKFFAAGNVHSFSNFFTCYQDTSLWGIYLTSDGGPGIKSTVDSIIDEWQRMCVSMSVDEVERAKNSFKTNYLMQLDGTTPVCEEVGRHMVTYGRRIAPDEMIHRINVSLTSSSSHVISSTKKSKRR